MSSLPPRDDRYFEDYPEGAVFAFGRVVVDEAEVIDFARRYDPQSFHVDPAAAAAGPFGGLIASGWHTAAMMMRPLVDEVLPSHAALASPGIDELRWIKPVRPGDVLTGRVTIVEARRSRSKPDRGVVVHRFEVLNQDGELVMSMKPMVMMRARGAGD